MIPGSPIGPGACRSQPSQWTWPAVRGPGPTATRPTGFVSRAQVIDAVLDKVTSKGNRSRLISRAVLHYVKTQGGHNLRERLKQGYLANAERDLEIAQEWFPLIVEPAESGSLCAQPSW